MPVDEEFRKKFSRLSKEIEEKEMAVRIDSVRTQPVEDGRSTFSGYSPDAVDFIRRSETTEQALEIIDFLEKRGELSFDQAVRFRAQLKEKGLRSVGPKTELGYYERQARKRRQAEKPTKTG